MKYHVSNALKSEARCVNHQKFLAVTADM